jgi:hypothetical protein
MNPAEEKQYADAAKRRLEWALGIIQNHRGDVVFTKQVRVSKGESWVISVRLPGVIRVSDALNGEVLAESAPGDLLKLAEGFKSPLWPR